MVNLRTGLETSASYINRHESVWALTPHEVYHKRYIRLSMGLKVIEGTAAISNAAGDRHGLAEGERITELSIASLCVHSAGSVGLFLTRAYKDMLRGPGET